MFLLTLAFTPLSGSVSTNLSEPPGRTHLNAVVASPAFHQVSKFGGLRSRAPTLWERMRWDVQKLQLIALEQQLASIRERNAMSAMKEHAPERSSPMRVGVCVTGQIARLDLDSKIEHLFSNTACACVFDIVFVLAQNTSAYVNHDEDMGGRMEWTQQSISHRLNSQRSTSPQLGRLIVDIGRQEPNPLLHAEYVAYGLKFRDNPTMMEERARSHVRQWRALYQCHRHFVEWERLNRAPYDFFVKLRDDTHLTSKWKLNVQLWENHVVVPRCDSWSGYNDKVAMLDGKFGYAFFARPLLDWYFNFSNIQANAFRLQSPEEYLRAVMMAHKITVRRVSGDHIRAVTSRFSESGMCVHSKMNAICVESSCEVRRTISCQVCRQGETSRTFASAVLCARDRVRLLSAICMNGEVAPCLHNTSSLTCPRKLG